MSYEKYIDQRTAKFKVYTSIDYIKTQSVLKSELKVKN